jgi:hypothetical protein
MPPAGHALVRDQDAATVWPAGELVRAYLDAVADACGRSPGSVRPRSSELARTWVHALRSRDPVVELPAGHDTVGDALGL